MHNCWLNPKFAVDCVIKSLKAIQTRLRGYFSGEALLKYGAVEKCAQRLVCAAYGRGNKKSTAKWGLCRYGLLVLLWLPGMATAYGQAVLPHNVEAQVARRHQLECRSAYTLGTWGLGNTVWGLAGSAANGSTRYFNRMNAAWGLVNTGFAGIILLSQKQSAPIASLGQAISRQHRLEKLLLLNTGLDAAYMATGFALIERSRHVQQRPERLRGSGQSLLLQGGFLLAFDVVQYLWHRPQGKALETMAGSLVPAAGPGGVGLLYKF